MPEQDNCSLRWIEFESNVKIAWQELNIEKDFCDLTLACEDGKIEIHKIVISACSPVLKNILKINSKPLIYYTIKQAQDSKLFKRISRANMRDN